MNVRQYAKAALTACVTAGLVLGLSSPAAADGVNEVAYISTLNAFGAAVYDAPLAIQWGYWACDQLNYGNGDDVSHKLYLSVTDLRTIEQANALVLAAAMNLCPWQYHPERLNDGELAHLQ